MKETNYKVQFCSIRRASDITGLSYKFIYEHIKEIPHAKVGKKYLVYLDGLTEYALKTGERGTET